VLRVASGLAFSPPVRAPAGLPRTQRLRRSNEFESVARRGKKFRDSLFVATAAVTETPARLGLAVSRKVSLKAVTRNRIKRQIRESFRHHKHMLHGLDIVVIAQAPAARAANSEMARSLKAHWERLAK
jgi:ribonuclease P protein component